MKDYKEIWRYKREVQKGLKPYLESVIPDLQRIHQIVKEKGLDSKKNSFEYNDMDNYIWYRKHLKWEITCFECQNFHFMTILKPGIIDENEKQLLVYRFYENLPNQDKKKYRSYKKALTSAEWITQYYSDMIPENKYVHRPTEEYLLENLNGTNYFFYPVINLTWNALLHYAVIDGVLESFLLDVESGLRSLEEDIKHGRI